MARKENIFHRKDGRFEARYVKGRDENGRLLYGFCYGRTYEEAGEKAFCAEAVPGRAAAGRSGQETGTFGSYCDNWLSVNRSRLKISSYARYLSHIKNHIRPCFGDSLPCEITSEQVDDFIRVLFNEKNLSSKTVRDILALFHSIFSYVRKRSGRILQEPEIVYPKRYKKEVRILNVQEEETLVRFLSEEMDLCKFGVYLALRTGLRIGELCALRWGDISVHALTISIRHTLQRIQNPDGESTARTQIILGTPKSDSSCRLIPLMPDTAALCHQFCSADAKSFVLTGNRQCMEPRKLQRRLKTYTEKCRLQKVHFHTLRHTFATRCIEVGCDMKTLSEILGHSNISVTMNQYVHPNLDQKRENLSRLKTVIHLQTEQSVLPYVSQS